MKLKATIHKTYDDPNRKLKAIASVTLDGSYAVHGLSVYDGQNGLYVKMPATKYKDEYNDTFHPVTKEARRELFDCVLGAYEQTLGEQDNLTEGEAEEAPEQEEETEAFEQSM